MPTLLAIDLGTTTIKGAVLDMDALRSAHIERLPFPEPLAGRPDLYCEIDVAPVVQTTRRLIEALLPHAADCAGIVCCGQMGGLVLCSPEGAARSNYISWRDQRLLLPHATGRGSVWEKYLTHITPADRRLLGNEVRPGLTLSFLYWLAEQGQLPEGPLVAAALPDFVLANLCGSYPATGLTNACGAVNVESGDWHHDLFARLGLERIGWPALRDLSAPVGVLRVGGQALPCFAPAGDHQTALAGTLLEPGELSLNISTGSQASLLTHELRHGDCQLRPYFDGLSLNTVTHIPAGRALNVLVRLLGELAAAQGTPLSDPWAAIAAAVEATPDSDLDIELAFFPGPLGERGAIRNIHEGNLRVGQLFRAAYRAMAANYLACAERLSPGHDWRRLVFSGGLAQHQPALRALIMERFGCAYRISAGSEDTLVGLMALGQVALGAAPSVQAAIARLALVADREP